MNNKILKLISIFTPLTIMSGCADGLVIAPTYDGGIVIRAQKKTPPRITNFDYYPKSTVRRDDVITFTVNASNKINDALQYTWKCSKGTLLSNSGSTVSWKPERADGSLETGTATITVTVSDDSMTVDASANVFINSSGGVTRDGNTSYDNYNPEPYYTPRPVYTPYPTYTTPPTYYPDYNYGSGVIFFEDFESGYLDDRWNISQSYSRGNNYLTWKKGDDDVRPGNKVAVYTGPTDFVLPDTCTTEVRLTSQGINLRNVKLPRLHFEARSYANPANSVKLRVYWAPEAGRAKSLNVSFIADKTWSDVDVDLQNLLSESGGSAGLLSISAEVCNNKNEFKGPMIDNIKVYDASR